MVNLCAMMNGLAILLLDSTLVKTPAAECLRPHAYAHSNAGKLYGSRPPEARAGTAGAHGISTAAGHIRTSATREVGSDSYFQVRGKLG